MRVVCCEGLNPLLWGPSEGRPWKFSRHETSTSKLPICCKVPSAKWEKRKSENGATAAIKCSLTIDRPMLRFAEETRRLNMCFIH
jgi:hypothetical protein